MTAEEVKSLTASDLVIAYAQDAVDRSVGVNYRLAQEVDRRGLRDVAEHWVGNLSR